MDDAMASGAAVRSLGVPWRLFTRALAEEVDALASPGERDEMLRGMGRRLARMAPLPPVEVLDALEIEMNDALEALGLGRVELRLDAAARVLALRHVGLPRVGSLGDPAGQWLAALLEGLYGAWFAQQPGHQASLVARRRPVEMADGGAVILQYARA